MGGFFKVHIQIPRNNSSNWPKTDFLLIFWRKLSLGHMWGQRENQVNIYCFGVSKKGTECCGSHGAQAESTIARTPCVLNCVFGLFYLTSKTKQDQAIPSHCNGHWHAVFALYTGRVCIHALLCDNCNNISTMFNDWLSDSLTQTTKLSRSDRIIGSSFEIRAGRELKTDSRFSALKAPRIRFSMGLFFSFWPRAGPILWGRLLAIGESIRTIVLL